MVNTNLDFVPVSTRFDDKEIDAEHLDDSSEKVFKKDTLITTQIDWATETYFYVQS